MSVWCANGHSNDESARFCATCGVGIAPDATAPPPPQQASSTPLPGYPPPPPGYGTPAGVPAPMGQPGYPAPANYMFAPQAPFNGLAIASMVLGIVWLYWIGSILALIFGLIARRQIKRTNQRGMGMAIAGIVLGCVGIATLVVGVIIVIAAHVSSNNSTSNLDLLLR